MEKRLGKGLESLIPEDKTKKKETIEKIRLKDIIPNPFQPRRTFGEKKMGELVMSMREKGVIQPILVRRKGEQFELIAGERRWRAAQQLEIEEIPAIIRKDIDDSNSLEISLIENIQREELNPMEEARAFKELTDNFTHTLDTVGAMMGKDKTTIANTLRLLALPEEIQNYIEEGLISMGHAKALLSVSSEQKRKMIAKKIIEKGLSVREIEHLVRSLGETRKRVKKTKDPELMQVEEQLRHKFGTKVNIHQGKKRGHIEIQYFSTEDLNRLLSIIL
ncbi:MAG: ParB/RepB/Spo0J family partition protein [Candidatus Omnitrophota bacterium]|nr:ParB/RepB/Spo0J family partition protein [Candidatus Omnitrophota bacterium]